MKVEGAGTVRTLKIAALVALLLGAYALAHELNFGKALQRRLH